MASTASTIVPPPAPAFTEEEYAASTAFFDGAGPAYEKAFAHDAGLQQALALFVSHLPSVSASGDPTQAPTNPVSDRILDVGCGTGTPVARTLAAAGRRVHGIDLSPGMVALASQAVPPPQGEFEVADMRTFSPKNGERYAGIIASLSLFLLSRAEIEALVFRWSEMLVPGGVLMVATIRAEAPGLRGWRVGGGVCCCVGLGGGGIPFQFFGRTVFPGLFSSEGWRITVQGRGFEMLEEVKHVFEPPAESGCEAEDHLFFIARKRGE